MTGVPAPGLLLVTQLWDDIDGEWECQYRVDHADPVIWITAELVAVWYMTEDLGPYLQFDGTLLKVDAVNGRFIYELDRLETTLYGPCFVAHWPD